ncbi:enoyl-CoA hydratase/isomerase family protein [Leifsonia kafniensis]|uniref:3-hydroxyisobutyryl-CoA hydrolase n=1 Tax=Leifsonia kafniensis TaxID=475957 RepID=A0ABP7K907_9MICO
MSIRVHDGIGHLTLNRPEALNALTHSMVLLLTEALTAWRDDPEVSLVVLDGAGDRGLCAGGDVRALYDNAVSGDTGASLAFLGDEYRLNAMIAEYPKPFVAIMDGVTMGGGIGLAGHAGIRVVTERSRLAMPETRIGFCPDVGGTWLLARAPGELGTYLALSSATMNGSDALALGFADYFVPSELLPHLIQAFAERADPGSPSEIVLLFDETPELSALAARRGWIDACFSADTVAEIIARLDDYAATHASDEVRAAADALVALSPTAVTVTLAALRQARELPGLRDALQLEYRACGWLLDQPDLREGIRAQIIDKDRSPRWNPARLDLLAPDLAAVALQHPVAAPLW